MSNVVPFQPKVAVIPTETDPALEARLPFSFDMIQTETRGMVLIDACVPPAMALEFLRLLKLFQRKATAA
jgi:hypothetical protein